MRVTTQTAWVQLAARGARAAEVLAAGGLAHQVVDLRAHCRLERRSQRRIGADLQPFVLQHVHVDGAIELRQDVPVEGVVHAVHAMVHVGAAAQPDRLVEPA